jgi:hypothetical protein
VLWGGVLDDVGLLGFWLVVVAVFDSVDDCFTQLTW